MYHTSELYESDYQDGCDDTDAIAESENNGDSGGSVSGSHVGRVSERLDDGYVVVAQNTALQSESSESSASSGWICCDIAEQDWEWC